MMIHETHIRVRYGETDQMGYVYYGNYALYYEAGRTEALRSLGITYKSLEETGVMMPVVTMNCRYLKAARYDDLLTVRTIIKTTPAAKMVFTYEVINEQGELINEGETVLVFIDRKTNRPTRAPKIVIELLSAFFS